MAEVARGERPGRRAPALERCLARLGEGNLLYAVLAVALFSHAYNVFRYPLYLGDEGIYLEQAWAVLREGRLSPYTYNYDHAPAGWLAIAWWVLLLPGKFHTFGTAINTGRVLMLLIHLASVLLLFKITVRLSGSLVAAIITCLIFSLSPLSLYYQRMVLLDNLMVFWVLVSLYAILFDGNRLVTLLGSAAAFALAVLTKENAVFFAPVLAYVIFSGVRHSYRFRFALAGWIVTAVLAISFYPLYAFLKSELLPSGALALLGGQPPEHVSLLETIAWQMSRTGPSILDPGGDFWFYFWSKWWPRDGLIIMLGVAGTLLCLMMWSYNRQRNHGHLVAALMTLAFGLYLGRGSIMIEFYVVPILPFAAMTAGMALGTILDWLTGPFAAPAFALVLVGVIGPFLYVGRDAFLLDQTYLQMQQLAYIRENIPPSAVLIVDDDLWVELREPSGGQPAFPNAHSHWKVEGDPAIRRDLLKEDYRNADYFIKSNQQEIALERTKSTFVQEALANSTLMQRFEAGQISLEVRKINK